MSDQPRLRRAAETYVVECHDCNRAVEVPVNAQPHRCPACYTPLLIQWGVPPFCAVCCAASDSLLARAPARHPKGPLHG
jgi:hypothetical protein